MFDLEREVSTWRGALASRGKLKPDALDELESHLRDEVADLSGKGLEADEAFLISVKRVGNLDSVAREFARNSGEELWKRIAIEPDGPLARAESRRGFVLVVSLAALAALTSVLPAFFGVDYSSDRGEEILSRFLGFFFIPYIGCYLLASRRARPGIFAVAAAAYALPALALALYPFESGSDTGGLSAIHALICIWLGTAAAYCGTELRDPRRRMDFVRYSGEVFLFGVLLGCGAFVLTLIVTNLFSSIGIYARQSFALKLIAPITVSAALFAAGVLAKAKRNVIENFAPVMARIFVPLFLAGLSAFLAFMIARGEDPLANRDTLITFDFMLVLVVGLALYFISARDPRKAPGVEDWACLALIAVAIVIDAFALAAVASRIEAYGASPNKLAALGENVLLLVDLAGLALCYAAFIVRRTGIELAARWQTSFFAVIFAWAGFVALAFPPIFGFR